MLDKSCELTSGVCDEIDILSLLCCWLPAQSLKKLLLYLLARPLGRKQVAVAASSSSIIMCPPLYSWLCVADADAAVVSVGQHNDSLTLTVHLLADEADDEPNVVGHSVQKPMPLE